MDTSEQVAVIPRDKQGPVGPCGSGGASPRSGGLSKRHWRLARVGGEGGAGAWGEREPSVWLASSLLSGETWGAEGGDEVVAGSGGSPTHPIAKANIPQQLEKFRGTLQAECLCGIQSALRK
jgi:hypothetical protein